MTRGFASGTHGRAEIVTRPERARVSSTERGCEGFAHCAHDDLYQHPFRVHCNSGRNRGLRSQSLAHPRLLTFDAYGVKTWEFYSRAVINAS